MPNPLSLKQVIDDSPKNSLARIQLALLFTAIDILNRPIERHDLHTDLSSELLQVCAQMKYDIYGI